jgi:GH35 family endo-1,4-beta-xylanase
VIRTKPGASVSVTQKEHEFWFGTAIARTIFRNTSSSESKKYLEILKANFNSAVCENAMKWYGTQRRAGPPNYADADRMVAWCRTNGLRIRGHCIFWATDKYVQAWVKALDDKKLRSALEVRADGLLKRYRGTVVEYDVNNEMIHTNYYARRLGDGIRIKMFQWARRADPKAILYVNDYAIISGRHGPKYIKHIEKLIAAGAPVGGIGVQGHFHRRVNTTHVKKTLDSLAKFKLPIKITEFDINTSDEAAKAADLVAFYRTCFAHPSVEGILMWGFWEGRHWRPKAALWKRDFTPTPAAKAYRKLVFETWWTRWKGKADATGRCEAPAYFGRHIVQIGSESKEISLPRAAGKVELDARKAGGKKSKPR